MAAPAKVYDFLELFAGKGNVSRSLRDAGAEGITLDITYAQQVDPAFSELRARCLSTPSRQPCQTCFGQLQARDPPTPCHGHHDIRRHAAGGHRLFERTCVGGVAFRQSAHCQWLLVDIRRDAAADPRTALMAASRLRKGSILMAGWGLRWKGRCLHSAPRPWRCDLRQPLVQDKSHATPRALEALLAPAGCSRPATAAGAPWRTFLETQPWIGCGRRTHLWQGRLSHLTFKCATPKHLSH